MAAAAALGVVARSTAQTAPFNAHAPGSETYRVEIDGQPVRTEQASSMTVNATGYFPSIRAFGDVMARQRSGSIVSISSMYGMVGSNPYLYEGTPTTVPPDYFFHKAGMINVTRYWASHYGSNGVRVNVVSPGGIYNPEKPQAPSFLERYAKMTPPGRMADAPEIGGAVVFLLSDAASYITGANLPVDGGYTAR